MAKDVADFDYFGNPNGGQNGDFSPQNEWGTKLVTCQDKPRQKALPTKAKKPNKKRPTKGSASRERAHASALEGKSYLLTLSNLFYWRVLGSGTPTPVDLRRQLPDLAYRWKKASSPHHGDHLHAALLWPGSPKLLIAAIEKMTGVPRANTFRKNTLAASESGEWHLREKSWDEACAYLDAQELKHGMRHDDRRRSGASRNAPKATPATPTARTTAEDVELMTLAGLILLSPRDAVATYPNLGSVEAVKKRWRRCPIGRLEGYNRLTYRRHRGRNTIAYISPAIQYPSKMLKRILPTAEITSLSIRHRSSATVPIWAQLERIEGGVAFSPVHGDTTILLPHQANDTTRPSLTSYGLSAVELFSWVSHAA